MLGIIPGSDRTFEIEGTFEDTEEFIEGKLYVDNRDDRLYMYSKSNTRPGVKTGNFPIYNGKSRFLTPHCKVKYFNRDAVNIGIKDIIKSIDEETFDRVTSLQKHCADTEILSPSLNDGDNMFTQAIKSIINGKFTITDLTEMSGLSELIIRNYYATLNKITFMRLDKFMIWLKTILHMNFKLSVYDPDGELVVTYSEIDDEYNVDSEYDEIITKDDDFMKKLVFIIMKMKSIDKSDLSKSGEKDSTVNNLLVLLNRSDKPFSAQIFSRFIKMIGYSFIMNIYDNDTQVFTYEE